jgi:hypothetical protein
MTTRATCPREEAAAKSLRVDDNASKIIFLLGPPKLSPRFRACVPRSCVHVLPALSGSVVCRSIKVQIRPGVLVRVGHRGFCYGRWVEVSRESLLSSMVSEVVIVSGKSCAQEHSTKACNSLPNTLLPLKRSSGDMRHLSSSRVQARRRLLIPRIN